MQPPNSTATPNEIPSGLPGGQTITRQLLDIPCNTPRSTRDPTKHGSEILVQMRAEMVHCRGWGKTGFDHYLPFEVPEADIDAAVAALKEAKLVEPLDESHLRFTSYPVSPSKIENANEKTRYETLAAIADTLQKLTLTNGREASCQSLQKPDSFSEAETFGANFKIDALLKLEQSAMPPSVVQSSTIPVADLAVPLEYKTAREDARENRKQLLDTTTLCMNDDPRRMHIYGITVEDDTMAVWYFSRSHSGKSPDFKFTEDCRTYIRVMLSLMFATEEELGYDLTIQRHLDPEISRVCFVYEVDGHYYKTQRAIFDYGSLCTTGRATRVWEVIEVASFNELQPLEGSHTVVLKDVWLDAKSKTEGEIQKEIFDDLNKIADAFGERVEPEGFTGMDDDSKKMLRKCLEARNWHRYFLTLVGEWRGTVSKEVAAEAQPDSTLFDAPAATVRPSSIPFNREYRPKRHSRVVFKEVCVALHDVSKLGDVVTAMLSCVFALQLMFLAGWVHRDISSGNLYWFKDNGEVRGILADLEYAKRFSPLNSQGSQDPKTGTAFFMAVEIQKQVLLYIPPRAPEHYFDILAGNSNIDRPARPSYFVVHNFEHDMESIFWLLLWTLLVRFPSTNREQPDFAPTISEIFQNTSACSSTREAVFSQTGDLDRLLRKFLAPELQSLREHLAALGGLLRNGYVTRMYNFDDLSSYSSLYRGLRMVLDKCQQLLQAESFPDLLSCDNLYATQAGTVHRTRQVRKRVRTPSPEHDQREYRPPKMSRVEGSTKYMSPLCLVLTVVVI